MTNDKAIATGAIEYRRSLEPAAAAMAGARRPDAPASELRPIPITVEPEGGGAGPIANGRSGGVDVVSRPRQIARC